MKRKKRIQNKNYEMYKLKEPQIVLYDIALNIDLIPIHHRHSVKNKIKEKEQLSYSNTSNKRILSEEINSADSRITRSRSKKIATDKKEENHEQIKCQLNDKNIEINEDIPENRKCNKIFQTEVIMQNQPLIVVNNIKDDLRKDALCKQISKMETSISHVQEITQISQAERTNNNQNLSISLALTHCNYESKITNNIKKDCYIEDSIKKQNNLLNFNKDILNYDKSDATYGTNTESVDDINFFDEKNVTIDRNSKVQVLSNKSLVDVMCTDGTDCENDITCEKWHNRKIISSNVSSINISNKIFRKRTSENRTHISSEESYFSKEFLITCNNEINKEDQLNARINSNNKSTSLETDSTIETFTSNMEDDLVTPSSITSIVDDVAEPINIMQREDNHKSEEDELKDIPRILTNTLLSKNSNLENEIILSSPHDEVIDHRRLYSMKLKTNIDNKTDINDSVEIAVRHENYILDYQGSNIVDSNKNIEKSKNINKHINENEIAYDNMINNNLSSQVIMNKENTISQNDRKCKEINCDEDILNKSTSDVMDINITCSINEPLIYDNNQNVVRQKHSRQEINEDPNPNSKRLKLDRNYWLQNNTKSPTSKSCQHKSYDFSNVDTVVTAESNIITENVQHDYNKIDLREHLIRKRFKNSNKIDSTSRNNDADNLLSNEIISNNDNNNTFMVVNTMKNNHTCEQNSIDQEVISNTIFYKEEDKAQMDSDSNNCLYSFNTLNTVEKVQCTNQIDLNNDENITNIQNKYIDDSIEEDEDCLSIFAEEILDNQCEDTFCDKKEEAFKSVNPDTSSYVMSNKSFDKYLAQNTKEFNKDYAECIENDVKQVYKSIKEDEISNNQKASYIHHRFARIGKLPNKVNTRFDSWFYGYCFKTMKHGVCYKQNCPYEHNLRKIVDLYHLKDSNTIFEKINYLLSHSYNFLCHKLYIASLANLSIDKILMIYKIFRNIGNLEKEMIGYVIQECLNRQITLKTIVNHLIACIMPNDTLEELENIFINVEIYIKPGQYWDTLKTLVLKLKSKKNIIEKTLQECINSQNLSDIEDVNNSLINRLHPTEISELDKHLMSSFINLLNGKTTKNSQSAITTQNVEKNLIVVNTIASPDSQKSASVSQIEFSQKSDDISVNISECTDNDKNTNKDRKHVQAMDFMNNKSYILQSIDNLPDARSIYRDRFWKFYVDLDRFKKGLIHQDHDYVNDILNNYEKKFSEEKTLYSRWCLDVLQTERKRPEYHLANITRRTDDTYSNNSNILDDT